MSGGSETEHWRVQRSADLSEKLAKAKSLRRMTGQKRDTLRDYKEASPQKSDALKSALQQSFTVAKNKMRSEISGLADVQAGLARLRLRSFIGMTIAKVFVVVFGILIWCFVIAVTLGLIAGGLALIGALLFG